MLMFKDLGPYEVTTNDCVTYVCSVLKEAGLAVPVAVPGASVQAKYLFHLTKKV